MAVSAHDRPAAGGAANQPAGDDLDDLFGYDIDEDVMRSIEPQENQNRDQNRSSTQQRARNGTPDLGLEEEITVKKARKPIAKLDEERLLSQNGIPKLKRITKNRLKLKGKGHEFTDVGRLLNMYQLWLDDLYPRAKFEDGLTIIEKLGHTKRMQLMRRTWIDEGKPRDPVADGILVTREAEEKEKETQQGAAETLRDDGAHAADYDNDDDLFVRDNNQNANANDILPEDDLDMLLDEGPAYSGEALKKSSNVAEEPTVDDLDALLVDEQAPSAAQEVKPKEVRANDDFADEMEAMEGMWS